MHDRKFEMIRWLAVNGAIESAVEFQTTPFGIIVEVGAASEVFIPWGRVLEYTGSRGSWTQFHEPSNTSRVAQDDQTAVQGERP